MMPRISRTALLLGAAAVGLAGAFATAAAAQSTQTSAATPKNWNYEIKDGKRVPKGERKVNADGSWREEVRQGKCVTVKERTPAGEYRETRKCD